MTEHTSTHESTPEQREHLWDLIKDIKFAMFTTRHDNGHLHARPMTTQNRSIDEGASLWFFMSRKNGPANDLANEPSVNVAYADPSKDCYVSVSGKAAVVEDEAKKKALWSKMNDAWFPGGPTDPDVAMVEVKMTHAEYWDVKDSQIVQLFKMAKAAATGDRPDLDSEKGSVRLS